MQSMALSKPAEGPGTRRHAVWMEDLQQGQQEKVVENQAGTAEAGVGACMSKEPSGRNTNRC